MVLDKRFETKRVMDTPSTMANRIKSVAVKEENSPALLAIKILDRIIRVGKRPLQGTKLLVMIAINCSRGESIILQEITPAALQPNPIHMVKACLPWAQAFLK